jgi:mannose-1-phosphate guanylyltransferase/phosphomannomutase
MAKRFEQYGAVLPCGGKGERLLELTGGKVPKSLVSVGGKKLIRHTVDLLQPEIVPSLVFAVGHGKEQIRRWVNGADLPHLVGFSEQTEPGVLAAIVSGSNQFGEEYMVACNTDEVRLGLNLPEVVHFHESRNSLATMVVTRANHLYRHRLVDLRNDGLVMATQLKPEDYTLKPETTGLVNTGFLLIDKEAVKLFDPGHNPDWGGIIDPLVATGQMNAYVDERIIFFNVGTVEEYSEVQAFLSE